MRIVKPYIISKGFTNRKRKQLKIGLLIIVSLIVLPLLYNPTKDYVNEFFKKRAENQRKKEEDKKVTEALSAAEDANNAIKVSRALLEERASTAGHGMRKKLNAMNSDLKNLEDSLNKNVKKAINSKHYDNAISVAASIKEKASGILNKVQQIPADISGDWEGDWKIEGLLNPLATNESSFKLFFEQDDSILTGIYSERGGRTNISGKIEGKQVSFEYKYSDGGGRKYTGTINDAGTEVSGKFHQENGSGIWKMVKKTASTPTETSSEKSTSAPHGYDMKDGRWVPTPAPEPDSHVNSPESTHQKYLPDY